jgi:hypothetical protein
MGGAVEPEMHAWGRWVGGRGEGRRSTLQP